MSLLESPNFFYSLAEAATQQRAKRDAVGISDERCNSFDAFVRRSQKVNRPLDTEVLKVRKRRLAENGANTPLQRALARADRFRGVGQ